MPSSITIEIRRGPALRFATDAAEAMAEMLEMIPDYMIERDELANRVSEAIQKMLDSLTDKRERR